MKVFDAYGQYYDLLYKDKNYPGEVAYVDSLIKRFSSDRETILELGCGTGLHACLLAGLGYTVSGIDRSSNMLEKAEQRKKEMRSPFSEMISFNEGDIRTYRSEKIYDVAISLFHVMSYMETNDDLESAIRTAKIHLKKGGLFIFDCWHGPAVLADRPAIRKKSFENESIIVERTSHPTINEEKNTVDVNFDISILNKSTGAKSALKETHKMRYLFTDELSELFSENGLEIIHAEEWMSEKPLSESTWNACYVCKLNS